MLRTSEFTDIFMIFVEIFMVFISKELISSIFRSLLSAHRRYNVLIGSMYRNHLVKMDKEMLVITNNSFTTNCKVLRPKI